MRSLTVKPFDDLRMFKVLRTNLRFLGANRGRRGDRLHHGDIL